MRLYLSTLIVLSFILLFLHLGMRPFLSSGEARASEIANEMLLNGNYFVPHLNEEIILTKPPLFHWIIIGCYKIFGMGEFASRFPSAMSGILTVILVYLLGKMMWNEKTGFYAGLILLTSPTFFWSMRCARIDAFLLFLITASIYCFWRGYSDSKSSKVWFVLWWAFMGLAFLAKGPIGFVTPFGSAMIFMFYRRDKASLRRINWMLGIIVFLLIVVPWYAAIPFITPAGKAKFFFVGQNKAWFGGDGEWIKIFVYVGHLILGFFPWSIVLPSVVALTWNGFRKKTDDKNSFLWIWFLLVFLIFSFLGKKVSRYILPMYPACALLIARAIAVKPNLTRLFSAVFGLFWFAVLISVNLFGLYSRFIDPELVAIINVYMNKAVISVAAILSVAVSLYGFKIKNFFAPLFVSLISFFMFIMFVMPVERDYYSPKPFCEMLKNEIPENSLIRAYDSWDNTIRYYYGRHVDIMREEKELRDYLSSADRVYCFMWEKKYNDELPQDIKDSVVVVKTGYKVLDRKMILVSNKR